ncbi:MAG: DUF6379 domain-containing protein [Eubacteriales bacterium]|nr:DUF6379 domain-containing protein [Eubacteriales bacterium]
MFMSQFAQWDKYMLCDEPICNVEAGGVIYGYEFKIHYPTYRGTYLSCIEDLYFELDGKRIPDETVQFRLNGKQFLLSELEDLFQEYWWIRDDAVIRVVNLEGLEAGSTHTVHVHMQHRIPYTGYEGEYGVEISDCTKELTVR